MRSIFWHSSRSWTYTDWVWTIPERRRVCVWISHHSNCFANLDIPRIDRNVCIHSALTNRSFMLYRLNYLILHGHSTISQPMNHALSVYTDQTSDAYTGIYSRSTSSELMKKLCSLSVVLDVIAIGCIWSSRPTQSANLPYHPSSTFG